MDEEWARLDAAAGRSIGQGRYADAAALLRQVIARRPDHPDSWFNLGYVLRQTRAYPDALEAYAEALRRDVSAPEAVHVNRAAILSEYMERNDEAEAELRAAVAKNPKFLPAWLNLGGLMEDVGKADAAADAYRKALGVAPGNGRARARLAAIRVHKGDTGGAIRDLEQRLQIGADSQDDVAELLFGLGHALDAARRYPEAFAAITQANRINAAMRPAPRRYDRAAQERLVDDLIAAFPARPGGPLAVDGPEMLFICGMFRSGSTVIEQLLGRHPLVRIGGELELIPTMVLDRLTPYPAALQSLTDDDARALRDTYLHMVTTNFPGALYVTDKRPDNFLHIGLIKTLFPAARIVHTERAALDTILSLYFMNFAEAINYTDRLDDAVHYFAQYRRLMAHWQAIFGDDIQTIAYDRLVQAPATVIADAWAALGLPAADGDPNAERAAPVIRTPSNWNARSAIHGQSSGRWKNYAAELAPARAALEAMGGGY
ncbi:sulfotransferase [Sphingopyxis sp.]|uniref:sulfotransferase family protein n=1 Tax=Sphingopyxis sp. TaxID=1908224 RepID=UPI003F71CABA